jgi:4-amino-4-deoxy-L-arabinose transferase-like glycosyltransferase
MSRSLTGFLLVLILLFYAVLGTLFALSTPAWEAPDEPAHYNYVSFVAEHGRFPTLQMGDYPQAYLEEIKTRRFPTDLSIAPIRYEFHQPPLYYALAAPLYRLTGGNLAPLRLLSVLLGAGVVVLAFAIARRIYPAWPGLAAGTAAFVAFLPQHLATVSQVGNDVMAELLFALALFVLIGWIGRVVASPSPTGASATPSSRSALAIGILLGLILITKTTAYIALALAGGVLIWAWVRQRTPARRLFADTALIAVPVLLIALPWYVRDVVTYGWPDFLGLGRHDAIVVGQLRTGDYLAGVGLAAYLQRLVEFTFKSFWGVFGWLGVFMDSRVYFVLALACGIVTCGLVLRGAASASRARRTGTEPVATERRLAGYALRLLAFSTLLTLLVYGWYNMQFVQHQGRYLFTALIPVAIGFGMGWDGALRPRNSRLIAGGLLLLALMLIAGSRFAHQALPKWPLALTLVVAAGLAVRPLLPRRFDPLLFALPFAALSLLDWYALFGAILPQLAR